MSFANLVHRARGDFLTTPRLELTLAQAVRLWGLGADDCRFVVDTLVDAGFLMWTPRRTLVRRRGRDRSAAPARIPVGQTIEHDNTVALE